jgi:putative transposase
MVYNYSMQEYKIQYKSNKNVVYSCKYHIVWTPKYRRPVLQGGIDSRLKTIIQDVCKELDCELLAVEVLPDHIHILAEVEPQFGIHRFVKTLKGKSSHILRSEFPMLKSRLPTLWSNSYFVSTVGGAPLAVIKQYVESQKNF